MKKRDLISSVVWMALGGTFVVGALQLGLTLKGKPGPGFLPLLTGLALVGLGFFVLVPALLQKDDDSGEGINGEGLRRVLFGVGALLAWGAALDFIGYVIATFLFMTFVTRILEAPKWRTSILIGLLTSVLSYLLFSVLMEVQLPQGPLTFF